MYSFFYVRSVFLTSTILFPEKEKSSWRISTRMLFFTTHTGYDAVELVENKISYCGLTLKTGVVWVFFPPLLNCVLLNWTVKLLPKLIECLNLTIELQPHTDGNIKVSLGVLCLSVRNFFTFYLGTDYIIIDVNSISIL